MGLFCGCSLCVFWFLVGWWGFVCMIYSAWGFGLFGFGFLFVFCFVSLGDYS